MVATVCHQRHVLDWIVRGLSAAENTFRLEEMTIAEIHEAVVAGALSSEKLVELYLARLPLTTGLVLGSTRSSI